MHHAVHCEAATPNAAFKAYKFLKAHQVSSTKYPMNIPMSSKIFRYDASKDINGRGELSLAVGSRPLSEIICLLKGSNADEIDKEDVEGRTALSWAAEADRADVVNVLLEYGAELDRIDYSGRSPLSWAAASGALDVVDLLIGRGANVNLRDTNGVAPLGWAYWAGRGDKVDDVKKLLRNYGASRVQQIWAPSISLVLRRIRRLFRLRRR